MDASLPLLLQKLIDGQTSIENRLSAIEVTLAEKRGQHKVTGWLLHGLTGTVSAIVTALFSRWLRH